MTTGRRRPRLAAGQLRRRAGPATGSPGCVSGHRWILEDLLQSQGIRLGLLRHRLLPALLAGPYRVMCWALFLVRPAWSYRLNASFEDHAEHQYMAFVAAHPELEEQVLGSEAAAEYGRYDSVADLLRQIGHDERTHKLESLHSSRQAWHG